MNENLKYFIYCRKSTEDSQKQIASINDQMNALCHIAEREQLFVFDGPFIEEKSAKDPGRVIFNLMLSRIEKGVANAILCWDFDRLSRNPIDNGRLQWLLQKGIIKVIKTPGRSYYPNDAGLLLSIEGGRSTDYVIKLSKDVKRGLDSKAFGGWKPNLSPIGYINTGVGKGNKIIAPDPERFHLVRKMWGLFLTGMYSVPKVREIAVQDWGLRTIKHRKIGGNPISRSHTYNVFGDTFYFGYYAWKDPDTGELKQVKGNHKPMITEEEYWRAQVLLGKKGKPRPKTREFAYTGCIRCGECNSFITAEEKSQIRCTNCRYKFSFNNVTACPKCSTDISDMENPIIRKYVYYRCVKKRGVPCKQKYVTLEDLEAQVNKVLEGITIDQTLLDFLIGCLREQTSNSKEEEIAIKLSLQSAYDDCIKKLHNLQNTYLSPLNSKHELFTEQEFLTQKRAIASEKEALEQKIELRKDNIVKEVTISEKFFNFCQFAKHHFNNGDLKVKKMIFRAIGSNWVLKDKKLFVDKHFPYLIVEKTIDEKKYHFEEIEPENPVEIQEPNAVYMMYFPSLCSTLDAIRTWIRTNIDNLPEIPDLEGPKTSP